MPHRLLLPLLLVALSGLAQTKEPGPTIHAKFRVLSLDGPILGAGYLEGKNLRRLDISADAFTAEQTYAGGNPLRLVDVTGPAAATNRFAARQAHQEIQGRLQALAQELQDLQSKSLKPKNGAEGGGGSRLASSPRGGVGDGRAAEIQRAMAALHQQLELIEGQLDRAEVPRSETPVASADKPKSGEAGPEGRGTPAHRPLVDFTFPGDGRFLLLVHRTAAGTTVNAIDDPEGAFPYGSMQFLNLTGVDVEVRFGAQTLALAAKGKGTLRAAAGNNRYAAGEIHTKGADGFHLGYSMRVFLQEDVRTLYFLLPAENGGPGVRLKGVEERRAPEPPPAPAGATAEAVPAAR